MKTYFVTILITILIGLLCHQTSAQVNVKVMKPNIHKPSVNEPDAVKKYRAYRQKVKDWKKQHVDKVNGEIKSYKQQYDSLNQVRKELKKHKEQYDSLSELDMDSVLASRQDSISSQLDSLHTLKRDAPWEEIAREKLEIYKKSLEAGLEEQLAHKAELPPPGMPDNDFTKAMTMGENLGKTDEPEIPNTENIMSNARQKTTKHFDGAEGQLQEAHSSLKKLRKKYSRVENTKTMKGAKKSSSLKGVPLKKRIFTGGNILVYPGFTTTVDCSPSLGYRINKKWVSGVQYKVRLYIDKEAPYLHRNPQDMAGYLFFSEYKVIKGFFVHGSWERMNTILVTSANGNDNKTSIWNNNAMLGLGKMYRINDALKGTFTLKYNFYHKTSPNYPRAWLIDFGFQVRPGELFKRKLGGMK